MMQHYSRMVIPDPEYVYKSYKMGDNNIFTFDIETVSLYYINGKWRPFDYSIPQKSDLKHDIVGYEDNCDAFFTV